MHAHAHFKWTIHAQVIELEIPAILHFDKRKHNQSTITLCFYHLIRNIVVDTSCPSDIERLKTFTKNKQTQMC